MYSWVKDCNSHLTYVLPILDLSSRMTEDATNAEEWGPTTTAMASISDAAYNSEDYLRIVQVLHKR